MNLNFDATTVAPQQTYTPVPAGVYTVAVIDSEVKPTRSGNGQLAVFTLQIVDGEHAGRKLFARINVQNQNPETERIGQSQLSSLCHATGVLRLADTSQLHNKIVRAKVRIRKDEQYGDSNDVTAFEAAPGQSAAPAFSPTQAPVSAAPAKPQAATPPWAKKTAA